MGGKTSTTSVVNIPPPTAQETALQAKQVELLELQVQQSKQQFQLLQEMFPQSSKLLEQQIMLTQDLANAQRAATERLGQFEEAAFPLQLKQLDLIGAQILQQGKFQEQALPIQTQQLELLRQQTAQQAQFEAQALPIQLQQLELSRQQAARQATFEEQALPIQLQQLELGRRGMEFQEQALPIQLQQLQLAQAQTQRQAAFEERAMPLQLQQLEMARSAQEREAAFQERLLPLQQQQLELARSGQEAMAQQLREAFPAQTPDEQEINRLMQQRTLAVLRGEAPPLSEQQRQQIGTYFGEAQTQAQGAIRQFAEELAASRGMALSDSPVAGEALRAGQQLASSLAQAKAQAELNTGLAQQQFTQGVSQFQEQLRQQALQNRMALIGQAQSIPFGAPNAPQIGGPQATLLGAPGGMSFGAPQAAFLGAPQAAMMGAPQAAMLGAPGVQPGMGLQMAPGLGFAMESLYGPSQGLQGALGGMQALRLGQASRTTTSRYTPGILDYVNAAGNLMGGAGSMMAGFSTIQVKKDVQTASEADERQWLQRMRQVPVTRYRYLWEDENTPPHTGIIIETSPAEWSRDGHTVSILDVIGSLLASVKALDRRVTLLLHEGRE